MQKRAWGASGQEVSVIGQGTWRMESEDAQECIHALRTGLDAGMTHIDTAELYGHGVVEERVVREAIKGRREEVFLVSKVLPTNASRTGTKRALEQSLLRLGTDFLDGYLLHWPGRYPLEDTLASLVELEEEGKIRSFGVSNFDEEELAEAVAVVGEGRIACNQALYHLKERAIEHAVVPFCEEHGITVVAYSPFGSGDFPSSSEVLEDIGRAHDATPHQVALAFVTRRPIVAAIPKTAHADRARQNAAAGELRLTDDEVARIDEAFPRGRRRRGVPSL